jgi:hypothetical protein
VSNTTPSLIVLNPSEPPAIAEVSAEAWEPMKDDRFLVDTKENIGYLVHDNGTYAKFKVATGRNETVHYLGMTYKATTPTGTWKVKARNTSPDHITFGPGGRFLRLFKDGTEYTRYGIHDYAYLDDILAKDTDGRFFSMGCILVKPAILDTLEKIYALNGGEIEVATVYGLSGPLIAGK